MFYLTDIASSLTDAWLFLVGLALVALVLFAPRGILGWVRARIWRDLP
jgi:branched-chain amino acid transport system permease protein